MTKSKIDGLRTHRAQVSLEKREAVLSALEAIAERPGLISIAEVARVAGVSREFIHSHRDLHRRVKELNARKSEAQIQVSEDRADLQSGREADKSTLMTKVLRQRTEIETLTTRVQQLEAGRARYLGEQLLTLDSSPQLDAAELNTSLERIRADNDRLQSEMDEATRLIARLQDDLGGARQALAEALRSGATRDRVEFIDRPRRTRTKP
jgi:hypothetical protein